MPLPLGHGAHSGPHALHGKGLINELQQGGYGMDSAGAQDAGLAGHMPGQDDSQLYYRTHAPPLATVSEEEVLNTAGQNEMVGDAMPNLADFAAVAARSAVHHAHEPSRILIVRHVATDVPDSELEDIFKAFGDVQGLHTASKQLGIVVVAYYDLRAAVSAQNTLQGTLINKITIDVQFAPPARSAAGWPIHQGQVTVYNLDPDTSNEQLVWLFSKFGDVQGINQSASRPNQKFITFFDTRHAAAAMRAMNRAENLNKIPSHVTPQQIAALQTVTSGPNLMQFGQLPSLDAASAAAVAAAALAAGQSSGAGAPGGAWDALSNPSTMEGLLNLVNQQQAQQGGPGSMPGAGDAAGTGMGGLASAGRNHVDLESLAAAAGNARGLPLSDSASSIASVPGTLFMAQGGKGVPSMPHMPHVPQMPGRGLLGAENAGGAYGAGAGSAAQQQLNMLQASDAANMLMGLNLGGMDPAQFGMQGMQDLSLLGLGALGDVGGGAGGLYPGAMPNTGGLFGNNLNQLAALQALQQPGVGNMGQLKAAANAANLQTAARILQAAGLGQFSPGMYNVSNPYGAASAAQILQQAGLGLPGLGGLGYPGLGMPHGGSGGRGGGVHGGMGDNGNNARNGGRLSRRTTDPIAEAERKAQQEKLYALDLEKIARCEDRRTTLMIKNIPNKYTQKMLLATIDECFRGTYDFFYLPIDFKNKCNVGYAFINMVQPLSIIPLVHRFNHKKWERFNSEKVCNISYARIQGRAALVQHFQNSSLMHEDKRCRPILFTLEDSGEIAGDQEPFPASSSNTGTNALNSLGSGTKLSGLAGSSNSLRSHGGSTNSLRDLAQRHSVAQSAPHHA